MSNTTLAAPETIHDEDAEELKVTFYPPLFLQRRIWILDVLRAENVTKVLDVGCGEGQLLAVLCQPAPWLAPPPPHILPVQAATDSSDPMPPSPTYNDEIPNIHTTHIMGLDVSPSDLAFAVQGTAPPQPEVNLNEGSDQYTPLLTNVGLRWEDLDVKIWKGGLEVVNEEFVDVECIVSTEVIEHLPPDIFPAFAPVLLGVYHPRLFLLTTPSFTFNARFTAPSASVAARRGYPDPTKRTDRVFRHSDHKFEWTAEEFREWCHSSAGGWGYEVQISSVGRALEIDEWGRDEELGGATSVAIFRRCEMENRERKGRETLRALGLKTTPHELLARHQHLAHPSAQKPKTLDEIGVTVKAKMEEFREGFMRVEDLWFERDIAVLCGGWIEILIRAVESCEFLVLKRDGEEMKGKRGNWRVELVGGISQPKDLRPMEGETSIDHIPWDWMPGEAGAESSEEEWSESTDMDGDVSWNDSEGEDDTEGADSIDWPQGAWGAVEGNISGEAKLGWGESGWTQSDLSDVPHSGNSTAGWDGDESDDTN
ncbi:putative O-methyltransferase activity [Lyophyllum shimeji]|uniref:Small RNA 2'-O-methyltransferase n=1 Tax=Lyophyllum shimeji TaxID=47721 RepID=A0A9P3PRI8_LYOSH|nr:putative O-methyltransferase activity [Lyophyllum shimeji]